MGSPKSKSVASSSTRREKSAGGASTSWRSTSVDSSLDNQTVPRAIAVKSVVSDGDGSWNSRTSSLSDSAVTPRSTSRKPAFNQLTNQVMKKAETVFQQGKVLRVNYERIFGLLAPSDGSGASTSWRSTSVDSSLDNQTVPRAIAVEPVVSDGNGSRNSRTSPLSDLAVSRRSTSRKPAFNQLTNQVMKKAAKVYQQGKVLSVNYERNFGFLAPSDGGRTSASNVYFRVPAPGDQLTSTLTGGMLLIPGDVMEYELANCRDDQKCRAHIARLRECKSRTIDELVMYVKNLKTTAEEHPEIVLRVVTKCPVGFKLVLDYRYPSNKLLRHTLKLCQILSSSKLAGLYLSRLKQMYALFSGSQFLASEHGVRKIASFLSTSESDFHQRSSDLLKDFLLHLLEYIPSQLPSLLPLLMRLGECQRSSTLSNLTNDLEQMLPILHGEAKAFVVKLQDAVSLSCEAERFLRKVLNVLGGGSSEKSGILQPCSQLPLLPTMDEVQTSNRSRTSLPVVKQKGPYIGPEEYIDTYLCLLREDSVAGLLQGIHALRQGKVDGCDMKLWFHVSTTGVHFNHNASPGLTFAVLLPKSKGARDSKAPLGGSLVCFFDDGGGFDTPIWGIVSRCEEDADKTCVCFVDIVVQNGVETELNSASWSFQCARIIRGEDMVMAESPTYYKAYQPVLEALQLTDPDSIPFQEELVFVTKPEEPAPRYLKSTCAATLDWSCIFELESTDAVERYSRREIREGVGAVTSLLERGYKTSFDASQLKAVELAVNNRLTIIQGPPGTGKTYVGVKLLQLLLSASTFPQGSPVYVITFKNHALDQYLEKCLTFCNEKDSVVRVGGRSKSRNLEKYNLQNMMSVDDEFRFDRAENFQNMKTIREEMEGALVDVNRYLQSFDPQMILVNAPELHLNYFLQSIVPSARIEACIRRLPEGLTLVELIQGQIPENFTDRELVADVLDIRNRLVAEMGRWIPRPEVLQTAQAFLSLKKPSSSEILQAQSTSDKDDICEEQNESRKEEEERRSAYESLRQDINLELDGDSKKTSYQWLTSNFMKFSKEEDVRRTSVAYHRLNHDNIGSQFDWLAHENPYNLSAEHRAILVLKYWQDSVDTACERLARIKAEYDTLLQDTEQIGERRKLAILQKAKIIGMTTTGAAIHRSVLKHLSPAVILVEEAAEILEPQVLASLNSNLQHLILIGDHHQLRPQVESYELERWHGFGVSMFERLVEHNNLPYQPLALQCRMREEFVPMLLPIYPFLKSHTALVSGSRNAAPTCMAKTMFFWSHTYAETSQRSYVNQEEAHMVVALSRWIASELESTQSLKILAAYNGQVTLIRKLLGKYPELGVVEVRSIDSFQGAESEIVIVSLVRSNTGGNIGHLSMRNRLCVAASRARCGVYFVGNHSTLAQKSTHWRTLISYFESQNAMDSSIPLCCPRHRDRPPFALTNTDVSIFKPCDVCDYPCDEVLPCDHACSLTCHSGDHGRCKEPVTFTFWPCGHSHTRMCYEDEEVLSCKTKIMHKFEDCEHITEKECWEVKGVRKFHLTCQALCGKELKCGHICKLHCSEDCASAPCEGCQEIEKEKERIRFQILMKAVDSKRKELDVEIQKLKGKGDEGIVVKQVHPDDDTALSYFMAKDRAEKYIQPDCKTMIVVTKVQKVENLKLQEKFLKAQRDLINPLEIPEWLFYGGSDELLAKIVDEGFRAAHKKAHLFHVYSSKIAQNHDNHNLLLSEVHLGKTWRAPSLESVEKELNGKNLSKKGYDSVSLVGGQENEEELRPFGHIIINPEQAIPRFIVSYKLMDFQDLAEGFERFGEEQASKSDGMYRVALEPSSNFQGWTPEECHFRMAESQFFWMSKNRKLKVTKVEFIKNTRLEEIFHRKKEEFKTANAPVEERFVFHGTDINAIDKIATEGFKIGGEGVAIKCGASFGRGVYTAVNPDISVAYTEKSMMMLLSLAIPGKLDINYKHGAVSDVLVIKDVGQMLPRYVVYYS